MRSILLEDDYQAARRIKGDEIGVVHVVFTSVCDTNRERAEWLGMKRLAYFVNPHE